MARSARASGQENRKRRSKGRSASQNGAEKRAQNHAQAANIDGISEHEIEEIEDRSSPRAPIIYEIVRRLGEEELARPITSLWWSGVAAGLAISFSLLAQAVLEMYLPDAPWKPLVSSLGYSVGFLIVVLGRQQLFTENTITMVLPLMVEFRRAKMVRVLGIWGVVLLANLVGTLVAALFATFTPAISPDLLGAMIEVSNHATAQGWFEIMVKGIVAGFLVAAMVWLMPSANETKFHVITLITYLIAVGGFSHIVAGSVDAFLLVVNGRLALGAMIADFTIPVLIGNIIGGTALFAMISYAQVMEEM